MDKVELNGSACEFEPGFPVFFRTHKPYRKIFSYFKVIYVYRSPLDCLVSYYYASVNRTNPFANIPATERQEYYNIDTFVLRNIPVWIHHYNTTASRSDVLLCYEKMRHSPYGEFRRVLELLEEDVNEKVLRESIRLSSFENIRRMGREKNQLYGNHAPENFTGEFTRSGKTRQYLTELQSETVAKVKELLERSRISIDL